MHDALSSTINGVQIDTVSIPHSPTVDSAATPINHSLVPDLKVDVDFIEQESDVRHEPPPLMLEKVENASTVPQISTPADPNSIPIAPPTGTPPPPPGQLLEDVKMAEQNEPVDSEDVEMSDSSGKANGLPNGQTHESPVSPSLPAAVSSSETAVDSHAASSPYANITNANDDDHDHDKPPPAKRARKHSDAERASLANTGTPPPVSAPTSPPVHATDRTVTAAPTVVAPPAPPAPVVATVTAEDPGPANLSVAQHRFCLSTVRTLKRMKEAIPFNLPVDPVALGIPHYPEVIKHPMDFSTIERKLNASNPQKSDPNSTIPRYINANQFILDVRLIFSNCLAFNGPEHAVTAMGKRVEAVFDKQIKQMPPPDDVKPPAAPKKVATPPAPAPPPPVKKQQVRRASTNTVPVIRRNEETASVGRPKREIHPPAPKDLPYAEAPRKPRKAKAPKNAMVAEQMKFCEKIWRDLHQKQHYSIAHAFYEPVDPIALNIPEYIKVIKKPMDLATMKKKLDQGQYANAEQFRADFNLMVKNCFTFNPPGNVVHENGKALQNLFEEKWKNMPMPRPTGHSDDDDEEEEEEEDIESDDERAKMESQIADLESRIASMKNNLASLKRNGKEKEKKEKKKEKPPPPVASTSKAPPKQAKPPPPPKPSKKAKKAVTDDDVLTFEQKKDLSDTISKLDGTKLEKVIQIIHEGVPEIRDSTEEIELEIDQLPAAVLTKLYNFVIRPMKPPVKRPRTGKGTGTGGLKRKSMDEDVETKKIRALEEKLKSFGAGGSSNGAGAIPEMSDHSSAESSSDESSASDSE